MDVDGQIQIPVAENVQPTTEFTVSRFNPAIVLDSSGQSDFYDQIVSTPNYSTAEIDWTLNNGEISIWVQGSREDLDFPGNPVPPEFDPDRAFTTDWIEIAFINQIDNYQYLRFRVDFSVDPLQEFWDPLPSVQKILIPVSTVPD